MDIKRVTLCFGKSKPKWLAMPWKKQAIGSSNLRFPASLGKDLLSDALEKVMAWNGKKAALCFGKSFACVLHTQSLGKACDFGKSIPVALEKAQAWNGPLVDCCFGKSFACVLEKANTHTVWQRLVILEKHLCGLGKGLGLEWPTCGLLLWKKQAQVAGHALEKARSLPYFLNACEFLEKVWPCLCGAVKRTGCLGKGILSPAEL